MILSRVLEKLGLAKSKPEPKLNSIPPEYDDVMGGYWGNHIRFFNYKSGADIQRIWGHKPWDQRLSVGDVILSEMRRNYVWFAVKSIEYKSNPTDMFFADAVVIHWEEKPFHGWADPAPTGDA